MFSKTLDNYHKTTIFVSILEFHLFLKDLRKTVSLIDIVFLEKYFEIFKVAPCEKIYGHLFLNYEFLSSLNISIN